MIKNEFDLRGTVALLLQDHLTMLPQSASYCFMHSYLKCIFFFDNDNVMYYPPIWMLAANSWSNL